MPSVCHSVSLPFIWSLVGDEEREKDQTPRKKKSTRPRKPLPGASQLRAQGMNQEQKRKSVR